MPSTDVMHKFKAGKLHSGSKHGPTVKNRKQALAILMSEKENEKEHGGVYHSGADARTPPPRKGRRK